VLFELVAGRPPFIDSRVRDVLEAHNVRQPPGLGALVPDAPAWLVRLVARMLAKDPRQRPRSMDEVSLDLSVVALVPPDAEEAPPVPPLRASAAGSH
jgi:serine/threonine protein kinase